MPTSTEPIAILGADSHVGVHLCAALEARGLSYRRCVEHGSSGDSEFRFDPHDLFSVARACEGARSAVDVQQWLPIGLEPREARAEGVRRVRAMTDGLEAAGVERLVFVSHLATLGDGEKLDADSFHLPGTSRNGVVEGRWAMEAEIYRAIRGGLEVPVVIPAEVMGPGDQAGHSWLLAEIVRERWPAFPAGRVEIVDVRDLARSLAMAVESGRSGRRYVVSSGALSVDALLDRVDAVRSLVRRPKTLAGGFPSGAARLVSRLTGLSGERVAIEAVQAAVGDWRVEDKRARGELSFVARPLSQTIEDGVRWYLDALGWTP